MKKMIVKRMPRASATKPMITAARAGPRPCSPVRLIWARATKPRMMPTMLMKNVATKATIAMVFQPGCAGAPYDCPYCGCCCGGRGCGLRLESLMGQRIALRADSRVAPRLRDTEQRVSAPRPGARGGELRVALPAHVLLEIGGLLAAPVDLSQMQLGGF